MSNYLGDALIYYASACTASLVPGTGFRALFSRYYYFSFDWIMLGAISGLVFMVLQAWCGVPLAALFSVLVLALMTGGFHLDGLADTCDGVFSARSRDRMLEIMRDSRLGTHGGLALIFVVLAKILVLSELALRGEPILASLAAACAVSRGTAALLMYRHRYAREEGLGNVFIGN